MAFRQTHWWHTVIWHERGLAGYTTGAVQGEKLTVPTHQEKHIGSRLCHLLKWMGGREWFCLGFYAGMSLMYVVSAKAPFWAPSLYCGTAPLIGMGLGLGLRRHLKNRCRGNCSPKEVSELGETAATSESPEEQR